MTVEVIRTGWLPLFEQMRSPNLFLSRMFTIKPGGIYQGGKVAVDIMRSGEEVAIAIKKCTGPNLNDIEEWTTKEFSPPSYGEAFPVDVCDLIKRMPGVDPFTDAYNGYVASLMSKLTRGFVLVDNKIKRAIELQASQILQEGALTLTNKDGDTVYEVNFFPKTSHFPTAGTTAGYGPVWTDTANSTPMADLQVLAKQIRANGKINPDQLIYGESALQNFLKSDEVTTALDNRRIELGGIAPSSNLLDSGATFYGFIWVGTYKFEMWAYPDTFTDPVTQLPTEYINADKVVMRASRGRMDMTVAEVPLPLGPDPRVAGLMPGRMTSRESGFDVTPNLYATPNGKQIMGELESCPLLIPVDIDSFGCITTA